MRLTHAACRLTGVDVREVSIEKTLSGPAITAGYQMVSTGEKEKDLVNRHGKFRALNRWSKRTQHLVEELLESMEVDLLPLHFRITDNESTTGDETEHERTGLGEEGANQV